MLESVRMTERGGMLGSVRMTEKGGMLESVRMTERGGMLETCENDRDRRNAGSVRVTEIRGNLGV